MSYSTTFELKNVDPEDVEDVLFKIEKSFRFTFAPNELEGVKTFGELCDIITSRTGGEYLTDCTTQQAFYKLRLAIADTLLIDKNSINPSTDPQYLFTKAGRRKKIAAVNKLLAIELKLLRPKHWVVNLGVVTILVAVMGLFLFWKIALATLAAAVLSLHIADRFGREIDEQTVGEIARKMAREHYLKSRRNPALFNKNEVEKTVKKLFSKELLLDETVLLSQAAFN